MSRKNFLILSAIETLLFLVIMTLGTVLNSKVLTVISMIIMLIMLFHSSYLLIVKKSINLLAGMTEEEAIEIRKDPERLKKHEKIAQGIGILIFLSAFAVIYGIYDMMK
ncbi:hypothetical protein [Gemella sanguinis]